MAALRQVCWVCGSEFYGRADARYCRNACRQKAHRSRAAGRTFMRSRVATTIRSAREAREQARALREQSLARRADCQRPAPAPSGPAAPEG